MYSYIKGILAEMSSNFIVVEAYGVGYGICIPPSLISELPSVGTEVKIYTHFTVREDEQTLYGFLYREDREMFEQLITVSGVGPKGALSMLGIMRPDDLRMAIATGDAKTICQAPGIGRKTAERVILDLRDKVSKESFLSGSGDFGIAGAKDAGQGRNAGPISEAIDALTVLGYSRTEAGRAIGALSVSEGMTTEDIIKAALKNIRL